MILIFKLLRRNYVPIAIICVIYMTFEPYLISIDTIFRGWYIGRMVPSLIFFCVGFFLVDHKWTPQNIPFNYVPILIILFIILPLINGKCSINSNMYGISYPLFVMNAIISSILLFTIAEKIPNTKFIKTISKGTLIVLGTHMPILRILGILLPERLSFTFPFITIILCYYVIIACERYCPMLLGKSRSFTMFSGKFKNT